MSAPPQRPSGVLAFLPLQPLRIPARVAAGMPIASEYHQSWDKVKFTNQFNGAEKKRPCFMRLAGQIVPPFSLFLVCCVVVQTCVLKVEKGFQTHG